MNNQYAKLLIQALPAVIETEAENDRTLEFINLLMNKDKLSPDERKILRLLTRLVEDYEERTYPMPECNQPLETLKFLMSENNLKQTDLIDVFGTSGRVSDVINGKRGISKNHARKLADKFKLPIDVFI